MNAEEWNQLTNEQKVEWIRKLPLSHYKQVIRNLNEMLVDLNALFLEALIAGGENILKDTEASIDIIQAILVFIVTHRRGL